MQVAAAAHACICHQVMTACSSTLHMVERPADGLHKRRISPQRTRVLGMAGYIGIALPRMGSRPETLASPQYGP